MITGEKFKLSVVLVGGDFGTVTGGIHASKLNQTTSFSFGVGQNLQQLTTNTKCTDLEYSIHTQHDEVMFILSRDSITASSQRALFSSEYDYFSKNALQEAIDKYRSENLLQPELISVPVVISVTLLPCPLGFNLTGDPPVCQCKRFLQDITRHCTILNGTGLIYRNGTIWVSYFASETTETDSVLVQEHCTNDYCIADDLGVDLYNPDTQCAFNHSGILCGGCQPGLSLALGSSQCLPCTNYGHIALLLVFIVAGIALVLFIKVLDLTVSRGTIYGLIFYANVIWLHRLIFFPSGHQHVDRRLQQFFEVLKVFIAWLNLDLGIETCFIRGLDAYWKAWLQFVFPIYLWFIAGVIIVVCRYSTRATKFFGNNAVSVLATLLLMSYTKLLRTNLSVALFHDVLRYHPEEGLVSMPVWLQDGNVPYLGLKHSFLFVVGLSTMLFLWLPYTVMLFLVPFLKKHTDKRFLRWINKFKPLFDAYYGPLKDKHHYWIGVKLLIQTFLPSLYSITILVNVVAILIVSALLSIPVTHMYKKSYNALLEASFIFNLVAVSTALLSTDDVETRIIYVSASILVTFFTFCGILVFHVHTAFKKHCSSLKQHDVNKSTNVDNKLVLRKPTPVTFSRSSVGLRESLLESTIP